MMTKIERNLDSTGTSDANLVTQSLSGDREAFGQIVARYQTLICSLAYSGTGSLGQSEDLAQETFLTAFKQLAGLREPQKLRPWLCGIARNLIHDALRKQGLEPSHDAQSLDALDESPALEPHPREATISREEQAILWQAVERVPEIYREPLILFYREHKSVETVARQLDLTEDTAKQRLSRGRKLLHEQVIAFVEGALEQTSPGQVFTLGVLAVLPTMTFPAKAAALGTAGAAGKGVAAAKGATAGSVLVVLIGPALGVLIGFFSHWLHLKITRTPRERAFVRQFSNIFLFYSFPVYIALLTLFLIYASKPWEYLPFVIPVTFVWVIFTFVGMSRFGRKFTAMRAEEQKLHPELFPTETLPPILEYRSRATFLGLPLVHIRYRRGWGVEKKPAVGWIAFGETAHGILFACGRIAVGGISLGGMSVGLISAGALSFGLVTAGVFALGLFANGYMAVGWVTSAWMTVAMHPSAGHLVYAVAGDGVVPAFLERCRDCFLVHAHTWPAYVLRIWVAILGPALLSLSLSILTKAWLLRKARR